MNYLNGLVTFKLRKRPTSSNIEGEILLSLKREFPQEILGEILGPRVYTKYTRDNLGSEAGTRGRFGFHTHFEKEVRYEFVIEGIYQEIKSGFGAPALKNRK